MCTSSAERQQQGLTFSTRTERRTTSGIDTSQKLPLESSEHFQCGIGYPIHMDESESHKNSTTYSCMLRDRARLYIAITSSHMTKIFHHYQNRHPSSSSLSSANVTQAEARTNAVSCWCCNWVVSVEKLDEFVPSLWFFRSRGKPVSN